ncbi:hypothetical protein GCM10022256_31150 [Frondihabitans peucedani]|uniref:Uncharacterized protein n=1 Tax=Frondihabitans peucedani TaxID=598626 RepID=A0ABP8E5J2_9MICO
MLLKQDAAIDDEDLVGNRFDLRELMAGYQNRSALLGEATEEDSKPRDAFRIKPIGGLIEKEEVRRPENGDRQSETLAHTEREVSDSLAKHRPETDRIHTRRRALPGHSEDECRKTDRLPDGPTDMLSRGIQQHPHLTSRVLKLAEFDTAEGRTARGAGGMIDHHAEGRRLAGSIRTEKSCDGSWWALE